MSTYPAGVYAPRAKQNKAGVVYDPTKLTVGFVEDVTKLDDEVVAIENCLGTNAKGTSASVKEKIAGIRSLADATADTIIIKGGNVGIGTSNPTVSLHIYKSSGNIGVSFQAVGNNSVSTYDLYSKEVSGTVIRFQAAAFGVIPYVGCWVGSISNHPLFFQTNDSVRMTIDTSGNVGINTTSPTAKLDILSDIIRLRTAKTPATAGAAGNTGDICWDANYIYICVATNTWKRSAIATW